MTETHIVARVVHRDAPNCPEGPRDMMGDEHRVGCSNGTACPAPAHCGGAPRATYYATWAKITEQGLRKRGIYFCARCALTFAQRFGLDEIAEQITIESTPVRRIDVAPRRRPPVVHTPAPAPVDVPVSELIDPLASRRRRSSRVAIVAAGGSIEPKKGTMRALIYAAVSLNPAKPSTTDSVSKATGISRGTVSGELSNMVSYGYLRRVSEGCFIRRIAETHS